MTKLNPCKHCRKAPSAGYYPGDYAIECNDCLTSVSRHMVNYPHKYFTKRAKKAKEAATEAWNILNPKG